MSDKKRLFFIYNQRAGRGQITSRLSGIIRIFTEAGYEVTVHPTLYARDAIETTAELEEGYDLLVTSGGDGTIDEVVTGLMRRKAPMLPIGYIPAGSTNDFASSLGISSNMLTAAKDIVEGVAFPCDVGNFQGDNFIYVAAFGAFTDVSYETPREMKNMLGHLAYLLEGVKHLSRVKPIKMKVYCDGEMFSGNYLYGMVTNSRSVGGIRSIINGKVMFDDGVFEVMLIEKPKYLFELQNIASALMMEQINSKYITTFKARRIVFESEKEIPWTLDGEYGGSHKTAVVEVKQRAVTIMLPKDKLAKVSEKYQIEKVDNA